MTCNTPEWPLQFCYVESGADGTLWRGEAADWLPHWPTPLTRSIFVAAQTHMQRVLGHWLRFTPEALWRAADNVVFLAPSAWQTLAERVNVPYGMVAYILGVPGADATTRPPRRRWGGLLPPASPHQRWRPLYPEAVQVVERMPRWARKVMRLRWEQAEILQVMEEISVRVGEVLATWALTTLVLADVLHAQEEATPGYVYSHLDLEALPSLEPVSRWGEQPDAEALAGEWPWLSVAVFEVAAPRWEEMANMPGGAGRYALTLTEPPPRADGWTWVLAWLKLREAARVALGWVITASRHWTLAAAREAMADGRLQAPEEAFLLELEEIKQLMTGEWSDPSYVQARVQARRAQKKFVSTPPPWGGERVRWRDRVQPVDDGAELVGAAGWHPGDSLWLGAVKGLAALSAGVFAFGRLLAARLGIPFVDGRGR